MITEEDFNNAIETIKGKLDETNSALISDDLLSMKAGFDGALSLNKEKDATIEKLNNGEDIYVMEEDKEDVENTESEVTYWKYGKDM